MHSEAAYLVGEGPSELIQGVNVRVASVGPHDLDLTFLLQSVKYVRAKALCDASLVVNATIDVDDARDVIILCCIQDDSAVGLGVAQQAPHSLSMAPQVLHCCPHIRSLIAHVGIAEGAEGLAIAGGGQRGGQRRQVKAVLVVAQAMAKHHDPKTALQPNEVGLPGLLRISKKTCVKMLAFVA